MKNDLSSFEKTLLVSLNRNNKTSYTHLNFMEWSSSKKHIEDNLKEGEKCYEVFGYYVAIKEVVVKPTKKKTNGKGEV